MLVVSVIGERSTMQIRRKIFRPFMSMVAVPALVAYGPQFSLYLPRLAGFIK